MLFNSFEFLLFLPIVFLLYWFVFKRLKWQNLFLVVASYVFYGWWDWRFLILIALTTLFSYVSGRLIARYEGQQKRQKALSAINIVLNLSILGVFKYYNFFAENFAALFGNIGWQIDWVTLDILLPVGISFYTFQALSYSIDVYQKKLPVCKDIIAFFAYISFFPQLVAGPTLLGMVRLSVPSYTHPSHIKVGSGTVLIIILFFLPSPVKGRGWLANYFVNSIIYCANTEPT